MANNRIYMRCRSCGETLFLGKGYLDGYSYQNYHGKTLERELNDFYGSHAYCEKEKVTKDVPYDKEKFPLPKCNGETYGSFDLVYEDGEAAGFWTENPQRRGSE